MLNGINKQITLQFNAVEAVSLAASRNETIHNFLKSNEDSYTRYQNISEVKTTLSNFIYSMPIIDSITLYMESPPNNDYQLPIKFLFMEQMQQEEWFSLVKNADFVWIGERREETNFGSKSLISFARKIYSPNSAFQALIVFYIKASEVQKLLQAEEIESNRMLFDSGDRLITYTGQMNLYEKRMNDYVREASLETNHEKNITNHSFLDHDALVVWSKFFNFNWLLVEVTPRNQLIQGSQKVSMILLIVGCAFIFIAVGFTLFLTRQFTRPIYLLVERMKQFSALNNKNFILQDYKNEFGYLFKVYNHLVERLDHLYQSLQEEHVKQRQTEIKALQAMINPHFFYNTLDQINWMAIEAGHQSISRLLELTAQILRIGLSKGQTIIKIREELELLGYYMEIQKVRFGSMISFHIDVPAALAEYYIPKFTLQPFVENSIIHGFHELDHGTIRIQAEEAGEWIIISIIDNGVGLQWKKPETEQPESTGGYGIKNVTERLEIYFGPGERVQISNQFPGVRVTLKIPKFIQKG